MTEPQPLLYDVAAAAQVLSIGRSKIYELLSSGELESVVIGRRRLIPADACTAFVARLRGG
jgi:excisionase family DNA binding protein